MGAPVQTVESLKRPASPMTGLVGAVAALTLLGVAVWAFAVWWKARNVPVASQVAVVESPVQMAAASDVPTAEVAPAPPEPAVREAMEGKGPETAPPGMEVTAAAPAPAPNREVDVSSTPVEPAGVEVPSALGTPMRTSPVAAPAPEPPAVAVATPAPAVPEIEDQGVGTAVPSVPYSAPTPRARGTGDETAEPAKRDPDFVNLAAPPAKTEEVDEFPELNLQGIFFRLKNPSVLINSRALYVGDEIGGARVVEIQRRTVTLEMEGVRRTLSMGGL